MWGGEGSGGQYRVDGEHVEAEAEGREEHEVGEHEYLPHRKKKTK